MNQSRVYLQSSDTGELVEASLFDEITDDHLALYDSTWAPIMQAHMATPPSPDRPEDAHWKREGSVLANGHPSPSPPLVPTTLSASP